MYWKMLAASAAALSFGMAAHAGHHEDGEMHEHVPAVGYTPTDLIDTAVVETPNGRLKAFRVVLWASLGYRAPKEKSVI